MQFTTGHSRTQPASILGRIGLTLFLSLFLGMGLLFLFFIGAATLQTLATYGWQKTPATITSSGVREDPGQDDPFTVEVTYRYQWNGRGHTSAKFSRHSAQLENYDRAREKISALPAGTETFCFVNQKNPDEAVLHRDGVWTALFAVIPLIFVLVGGVGIVGVWFPREARAGALSPSRGGKKGGKALTIFLGGVFTLVGAGMLVFWFLPTMIKAQESAQWTEMPCTIISSRVKSHSDSDGTTYSVDIFYRYTVAGREYKSNRHGHFGGSSSGYDGKAEIVRRYPADSQAVCYVNPENPHEAVLKPGLGWGALFGLIPLVFFVIGVAVLFSAFRTSRVDAVSGRPVPAVDSRVGGGPVTLKPTISPLAKLGGVILAALFWNGIVSVFVWQVIKSFERGRPEWFLTVFMIPFVLIGLGLLAGIIYFAAAATNPRCRLRVDSPLVRPGQTLSVSWEFRGAVRRLNRLRIHLEGREEATYARGTSTHTDREIFAQIPLADLSSSRDMERGTGQGRVPERTMPSFTAPNNKVVWTVKVRGEISRWPDVDDEYEIVVTPPQGGRA